MSLQMLEIEKDVKKDQDHLLPLAVVSQVEQIVVVEPEQEPVDEEIINFSEEERYGESYSSGEEFRPSDSSDLLATLQNIEELTSNDDEFGSGGRDKTLAIGRTKSRSKSRHSIVPLGIGVGVRIRESQGNLNCTASLSSDAESSEESAEGPESWSDRPSSPDLPQEFWQVQRLIKYIKAGNPTATNIALSALRDHNLENKFVQLAIKDSGGLELLLNILETDEIGCKIGSLLVLKVITKNKEISRRIYNMKGLETLVGVLKFSETFKQLRILTVETLSNVSKIKKARRDMRKSDGISRLVDMLDFSEENNQEQDHCDVDVARCGALALWSLVKSSKNKESIREAGAIPLLTKLMKNKGLDSTLRIPVVGILQDCATEPTFRTAIREEGLLEDFVNGLKSPDMELVQYCAKAIYMCAQDEKSRDIVYDLGAIDYLILLIKDQSLRKNKPLISASTGAIWKCATSIGKSKHYLERGLVEILVSLLKDQPQDILINISGALEEFAKTDIEFSASIIKRAEALPPLICLLTSDNETLLVNATRAVGELAKDPDCRREMESRDGFRLVWSLLKHSSTLVQSSAAFAICPYVESSKDSGDTVRNYVGGLEVLVHLLGSNDAEVQSGVSRAIAAISSNSENLSIMSDHGVVAYLSRLAPQAENDKLRCCLASAISVCCSFGTNSGEFGQRNAVAPICNYLTLSKDPQVHRAAAKALCSLSRDLRNCITIHQQKFVVPILIKMSASLDEELRNSSAGVMKNIRLLALNAELLRLL